MNDQSEKGVEVTTIGLVPINLLALDKSYQRSERNTIQQIIKEFDPKLLRPLVVSHRDNKYYIVDGQHRYQALKNIGVEYVRCEIFHGLTSKQEAEIFSKQNNNVAKLKPFDTFKSNIHINDEDNVDVIINNVVKSKNMTMAKNSRDKGFRCLYSLREAAEGFGSDVIEYVCDVLLKAGWAAYFEAFGRDIQTAILFAYKRSFDVNRVAGVLKLTNPSDFKQEAIMKYGSFKESNISRFLEFLLKG